MSKMIRALCLVAVLSSAYCAVIKGGIEVPTYTEPCRRNSPDFNVCIRKALQGIIPKLAKGGIPELELGSIDPLKIPEMIMSYDAEHIGGKVTLANTVTRGISKLKVLEVRSKVDDPSQFLMEIDFFIPKLLTTGLYKMQGHIGDIPVLGEDTYNISMAGVAGTWRLIGSPVTQDGETFMRLDRFEVKPEVETLKVHANNLFKGNQELSAVTLAFVNRFWRVLYEEMLPYTEETFDKVVRNILNKIFLKIPYDQLFPLA